MDANSPDTVTVLLRQAREGDRCAEERLFELVEHELRAIAKRQMRKERAGDSLQTTVIIDDVFLRLVGSDTNTNWQNRRHFYRTAAVAMRRMLIDYERRRRAQRRGGGHQRISLDPDRLGNGAEETHVDLLALDEALKKLADIDSRQIEVVELHHFGGCSLQETADLLGVSVGTVRADWRMAKAWLHRELTRD